MPKVHKKQLRKIKDKLIACANDIRVERDRALGQNATDLDMIYSDTIKTVNNLQEYINSLSGGSDV